MTGTTDDSIRQAVSQGAPDDSFVELLRTIAKRVSRGKPTPSGSYDWTDHDIDDLAFEIVEELAPERLVAVAKKAKNGKEFRNYLTKVARNIIAGRARKSPSGWVRATVDEKLADSNQFERHAGGWRLAGTDATEATTELRDLVEVAWTVGITPFPWDPDATRGAPLGHSDEIRHIAKAVLERAGWLTLSDLGQVVADRYNVSYANHYTDLIPPVGSTEGGETLDLDSLPGDIRRTHFEPPEPSIEELDSDIEVRLEAEWFVNQMRQDEILFVGLLRQGWTVEAIGKALGLGRSAAYTMRRRVADRLGEITADGEMPGMDAKMLAAQICAGRLHELRHLMYSDGSDEH